MNKYLYEFDIERLRHTRTEYERLFKLDRGDRKQIELIDANIPGLIVKSQVLRIASKLYSEYTGKLI